MSPTATTTESRTRLERLANDDGWRVWTHCSSCHTEMALDSPDELLNEQTGKMEALGKPNEDALKWAAFAFVCDECDVRLSAPVVDEVFQMRVERSGLPRDLQELGWDAMDRGGERRQAVLAARAWAERGQGGIMLIGPVGVGKTRLAATALWDAFRHRPGRYVSATVLIAKSLAAWSDDSRKEATAILTGTEALVLDDLGKEKPSEFAGAQLFAAIDSRIQAGAPLIVTTNLTANELADRMGDWIGSRLAGYCTQFKLEGRDRRLG